MTQTANIKPAASRSIRTPLDGVYVSIANRIGGSKAKEVERFLKFATVGTIGAAVDFGTLNLLLLTVLPPLSDFNVALATTMAFSAAVLSNFTWNRLWTYPDSRSRTMRRQLAQFATVSIVGWLARTTWITLSYAAMGALVVSIIQSFSPDFAADAQLSAKIGANAAQLIGIFVVMIWNFFANRYWTYNDVE